jgi:hypothetical protein
MRQPVQYHQDFYHNATHSQLPCRICMRRSPQTFIDRCGG